MLAWICGIYTLQHAFVYNLFTKKSVTIIILNKFHNVTNIVIKLKVVTIDQLISLTVTNIVIK